MFCCYTSLSSYLYCEGLWTNFLHFPMHYTPNLLPVLVLHPFSYFAMANNFMYVLVFVYIWSLHVSTVLTVNGFCDFFPIIYFYCNILCVKDCPQHVDSSGCFLFSKRMWVYHCFCNEGFYLHSTLAFVRTESTAEFTYMMQLCITLFLCSPSGYMTLVWKLSTFRCTSLLWKGVIQNIFSSEILPDI